MSSTDLSFPARTLKSGRRLLNAQTFVNDGPQTIQDRRRAVRAEHPPAEHPPAAPVAIASCASRNVD
jgi:hypothetical protein